MKTKSKKKASKKTFLGLERLETLSKIACKNRAAEIERIIKTKRLPEKEKIKAQRYVYWYRSYAKNYA